jgi:ABC-type glycerol-3-phosphate transport system substrate-binding protein
MRSKAMQGRLLWTLLAALAAGAVVAACSGPGTVGADATDLVWDQGSWDGRNWK